MFIHSVKVHRVYKTAAKIIKQVLEDGKGVKQLLFEQTHVNIKTLNALVFETLKHARVLDILIQRTSILFNEPRLDPWLARVLMTELLWGKKDKLVSDAKPVKTILTYSKKFQAVLRDLSTGMPEQLKEALSTDKKLPELYHPRYVRVNTLTLTMQEAIDGFRDEGWTLIRHNIDWTYRDFLKVVLELPAEHFIPDFHIPELLVFPPDTQFHDYQCYLQGHIVLQDKASCMAAHMLAPEPGSNVLDMCAAPGMKTTHLAAIVGNKGTIYAIEKDTRRHGVLSDIVQATNSTCVKTINEDALKITDEQCPDIEYILVDPSCSGTGMLGRIETAAPTIQDKRLERLAGFQILILRRALTAFPKAKRVLYSTCSTHTQENEQVVKEVLETTKQFRLVSAKELLKKEWLSFGSDKYEGIGENCLYSKSEVDYTNGFFIAVFERIAPHDERDVYVKGKKWKEIKQEPEDDYEYGNTDMVNYGMSNNNIRNNIKPENDQGQNDESIDYNKSYIKTELKEENTNDQKLKSKKIKKEKSANIDKEITSSDNQNILKSEKENADESNEVMSSNSKIKKPKMNLEEATTSESILNGFVGANNENEEIKQEKIGEVDITETRKQKRKRKKESSHEENLIDNSIDDTHGQHNGNHIDSTIDDEENNQLPKKKKKQNKNKQVLEEISPENIENIQIDTPDQNIDSTIDDQENNHIPKKKKKKDKHKSVKEVSSMNSENSQIDNEVAYSDIQLEKKKKHKKHTINSETNLDITNSSNTDLVIKDKKSKSKCSVDNEANSKQLIDSSSEYTNKHKKSKQKSDKDDLSPETVVSELCTDDTNKQEQKKKKKKEKKLKEKSEVDQESESSKLIENDIVQEKKPKKSKHQDKEKNSTVSNCDLHEAQLDNVSVIQKKNKKSKKHIAESDENPCTDQNLAYEETEVPLKKKKKNKKSKSEVLC